MGEPPVLDPRRTMSGERADRKGLMTMGPGAMPGAMPSVPPQQHAQH